MNTFVVLLMLLLAIGIYFLPSFIAAARGHHQFGSIFVINLLGGWTFLGWVAALAFACSQTPPRSRSSSFDDRTVR